MYERRVYERRVYEKRVSERCLSYIQDLLLNSCCKKAPPGTTTLAAKIKIPKENRVQHELMMISLTLVSQDPWLFAVFRERAALP